MGTLTTGFHFNLVITWVIATSAALLTFIAGDAAQTLRILLSIIAINMTLGLIISIRDNNVRSWWMEKQILIKFAMILGVLFAGQLDLLLADQGFKGLFTIGESNVTLTLMAIFALIGSESTSTLEKLDRLGVILPEQIKTIAATMTSKKQAEQVKENIKEQKEQDDEPIDLTKHRR